VGAIVVWDEDAPSPDAGPIPPRGLIRVALLGPDLRAVVQVATVSPEITDAERPRVALRDGGYWVAWIARKREPTGDAAPELLEAPGEDRAYRWVELLALDEHGAPAGAVRRLSSATGHVAGFSIAGGVSRLDAAIVLDDEQGEGAGGELLQVVATAEGAPRSVTVRASGVGRSPPRLAWAEGAPGWLAYVDAADHTRLVAIDAEGAAAASDAIEPALDDARLVAAIASAGSGASALAVTPGPKGALTWLSCQGAP
jgi:hypothetical protein